MKSDRHYGTVRKNGYTYVVVSNPRPMTKNYPEPDFLGTGMALCGVLKEGETLQEFIERKRKVYDRNTD